MGMTPFGNMSLEDQAQLMKQYTQSLLSAQAAQAAQTSEAQPVNMSLSATSDAQKITPTSTVAQNTQASAPAKPRPRTSRKRRRNGEWCM